MNTPDTIYVIEAKWKGKSVPWQATIYETSRVSFFTSQADAAAECEFRIANLDAMFGLSVEYRVAQFKRRMVVRGEKATPPGTTRPRKQRVMGDKPCFDCGDGPCYMNCGPAVKP